MQSTPHIVHFLFEKIIVHFLIHHFTLPVQGPGNPYALYVAGVALGLREPVWQAPMPLPSGPSPLSSHLVQGDHQEHRERP